MSLLLAALGVDPDPEACQLAGTTTPLEVADLDLAAFAAYGAHGVADVVVSTEPAAPEMVYFTEATMPDRALEATTVDGGYVAPNLPAGVYTVRGEHPDRAFDSFVATCEPGRFINAGPPQGLHERGAR